MLPARSPFLFRQEEKEKDMISTAAKIRRWYTAGKTLTLVSGNTQVHDFQNGIAAYLYEEASMLIVTGKDAKSYPPSESNRRVFEGIKRDFRQEAQ